MRNFLKPLFRGKSTRQSVEILPQKETIEISAGQTILECALANGIAYPHNCTVGTCGSCKSKLVEGEVKALSDFGYTLSKLELEAGYILACQAVPRGANTIVHIADPGADLPAPEKFQGRIIATEPLTHDILKVTVDFDRPLRFVAGQYASFALPELGRARYYSFADPPVREGRRSVSFFIRKIPGGEFTEALFAGKLADRSFDVEAPHGSFHLRPGNDAMVCIAGGSGLAPILSVLEGMRKNRVKRPCLLMFGARAQADLYALDQIKDLRGSWLDDFEFLPILSQEPADSDWTGARGFVTEHLADATARKQWTAFEGYMCGPPPMIDSGIEKLVALGVPLERIYYDKFTDGAVLAEAIELAAG
ncbi:MAG: 2Fe-2S iron-sulfur cluster binding domain-containing protein [Rudaea sp.]|uniref:2Fe-2S iron-sulfur cluster-binding protein n=1 Tax=Rudaea sp. TaxID=2136325 RepID=UPI0039E61F2F